MNDISDGLSGELEELAEASGQAMIIRREAVPLSEEVRRLAAELGKDPLIFASTGERTTSLYLPFLLKSGHRWLFLFRYPSSGM